MLKLRASILRALALVTLIFALSSPTNALPLPDHNGVCVDSARNQLLWKITYQGAAPVHLHYSSLNNAYRSPLGIDGTQPTIFYPEKPVYFWATLDKDGSDHRWVLAGNAITVRPASLPSCSRHLEGECVVGIYDYCDAAGVSGFCHPITCNIETSQCEQMDYVCPEDKPVCIERIRSCAECIDSSDCEARSPLAFCEGGWHCDITNHVCERTPPPCDEEEAECDSDARMCRKYACSSHADCDDGNPCNGREICDFNLRTCYKDPLTPPPCGANPDKCDISSGRCHECSEDVDCTPPGTLLYPCEPRKVCGSNPDFPSLRACVDSPPVIQCEDGLYCDNHNGKCAPCVYDDDCYPEEVQNGIRPLNHCDGEFYCHNNECVHYGRCMDDSHPFCVEASKVCSECKVDEDCKTTNSFCSPNRICNLQTGKCEETGNPCQPTVMTLDNGVEAEMPMECDEESRSCIQTVLCLDDSHCKSGSFCSLGERCNLFTGLCELDVHDGNGTIVAFDPCNGEPCLEDERRCGYPRNVLIAIAVLAGIWVVVLSAVAFLCACCGKLT